MLFSPPWRKFALAVHLTVSVGWIGAVLAYLAFDVSVAMAHDANAVRAGYLAMDRIIRTVIVPLAIASLVTGILISLGTKWGLFRHYWVVISLCLTVFATAVLLRETQVVAFHADIATDPTTPATGVLAVPSTLAHSIGGAVVLLIILVLNVYKPRGLTRHGRRMQGQARPRLDA